MKRQNDLWITKLENEYTIGMTYELQDEAGDIGFVNLTSLGEIDVDGTLAEVEASKMVIEIPSPLKGRVIRCNEEAEDRPTLLNSTDNKENWLVVLTDVDEEAYNALPDFEA